MFYSQTFIADWAVAMLCGVNGIEQATIQNSAAYLKTWIERLKSDAKLLVSAASAAQKAKQLSPNSHGAGRKQPNSA